MKKILTILLTISVLASVSQTSFNYESDFKKILARTKDANDNLSYEKLLKRFSKNDNTLTDFEVLALMIGFTDKEAYKPYDDLSTERKIYALNGEREYKQGLDTGLLFLKSHPVSLKTLFEISYSYYKLGKQDSSDYYMHKGRMLFKAMIFSGSGKSSKDPMFALGPADGQDYIYKVIGAKIGTMGSGSDQNGNFLDILEVLPKDGSEAYSLYFIIQHATNTMFKEGSKSKKRK